MAESIFSSYSLAENRVTACFLAVLRSLAVHRIERILKSLLEEEDFSLITLKPQPATTKGGESETKPDGEILSACQILIETKIVPKVLEKHEPQLRGHLKLLNPAGDVESFVLALTPDMEQPNIIGAIKDKRLRWASFADVNAFIEDILNDEKDVISEREEFLLREFQKLMADEGLLEPEKNVVVIAARVAWGTYQKYHAYICLANRPLGQARYLAFYANGEIQALVPEIREKHPMVDLVRGKHQGRLGELVNTLLDEAGKAVGEPAWHKDGIQKFGPGEVVEVVLLSSPDDSATVKLDQPIKNVKKSKSGKKAPFTMWQRYVSLPKLKQAKTTSELE